MATPKPQPPALPLPLPPPPSLINTEGFAEQVGQDHSFTKIHYYSSPGQVPFDWEAEPGKRKQEKEKEKEKEEKVQAPPLPLNLPPNMHSPSPAVSRTSSALSDNRAIPSNGKITHSPSQRQDYIHRRPRGKSAHKGEADADVCRSGCNPFCFYKSPLRSGRKLRNR